MRYDWPNQIWVIELKPRSETDENTWTVTPFDDEIDLDNRVIPIRADGNASWKIRVKPPELNLFQAFGVHGTNPNQADLVTGTPLTNPESLTNTASPDYLSRVKMGRVYFPEIEDVDEINRMGRRIFDASCHRRVLLTVHPRDWYDGLTTCKRLKVRGLDPTTKERIDKFTVWVKRRTLVLDAKDDGSTAPLVTLACDTVWESGLDE